MYEFPRNNLDSSSDESIDFLDDIRFYDLND